MMDNYITSRNGSVVGTSFTHLASITSTTFQDYSIDNMDQYSALEFYIIYTSPRVIVESMIMPMEVVKNSTSSMFIQPTYLDGTAHFGQIYYNNTTNSIFGKINNASSVEVYGIK